MDLGRQRTYTGGWTFPFEEHVKEKIYLLQTARQKISRKRRRRFQLSLFLPLIPYEDQKPNGLQWAMEDGVWGVTLDGRHAVDGAWRVSSAEKTGIGLRVSRVIYQLLLLQRTFYRRRTTYGIMNCRIRSGPGKSGSGE